AGAGRLDAEGRSAAAAEPLLQQHPAVGKHQIGGGGAEGDEVDVARSQARGLQCTSRGVLGQIDGSLPLGGHVTALDAGTGADPLARGPDELLEIEVAADLLRRVRAGAGDARIDQLAAPSACSACAMCAVSPRRAASAAVPI